MGCLNSDSIKKFLNGQVISTVTADRKPLNSQMGRNRVRGTAQSGVFNRMISCSLNTSEEA